MQLGLLLHDPEEEHDCFSDNTHWSHFYDIVGIENVYLGQYTRIDGSVISGPSLSQLVAEADAGVDAAMRTALNHTKSQAMVMVTAAQAGKSYDQMLAEGDADGNRLVQDVIDALRAQTQDIESVVVTLDLGGINVEGSDSLDDPNAVFQ